MPIGRYSPEYQPRNVTASAIESANRQLDVYRRPAIVMQSGEAALRLLSTKRPSSTPMPGSILA